MGNVKKAAAESGGDTRAAARAFIARAWSRARQAPQLRYDTAWIRMLRLLRHNLQPD